MKDPALVVIEAIQTMQQFMQSCGCHNLRAYGKAFEHAIDEHWYIAASTQHTPQEITGPDGKKYILKTFMTLLWLDKVLAASYFFVSGGMLPGFEKQFTPMVIALKHAIRKNRQDRRDSR